MEAYKALLNETVEHLTKEEVFNDAGLRNRISFFLRNQLKNFFPEGKINIYYNIDYSYYDIPFIDIMEVQWERNRYSSETSKFIQTIQLDLENNYNEYKTYFKKNGYDVIFGHHLQASFRNLLVAYRARERKMFNSAAGICLNTIRDILAETDGPEVPFHTVTLPVDFDYICPPDEIPPLSIGTGRIKWFDSDKRFHYMNNDVVSENMTQLFETIKGEVLRCWMKSE